jgi:hypothetical protein
MNTHVLAPWQAPAAAFPGDLAILWLWPVFGIALTGLFFMAGLGADITQAFAAAG